MKPIDQKILQKFITLAGDRLKGDWILIEGTVLPLLGIDIRPTVDIDVVGPPSSTQKETVELTGIAESLGLPVETINQAGAFFLHKKKGWHENRVLLHKGKSATVFRPNVTLYLELKLGRLTETDLADCVAFLKFASRIKEAVYRKYLTGVIVNELKKSASVDKKERLQILLQSL